MIVLCLQKEQALLEARPPETVADYERLVLTSPNSSFVWIKYIAYQIFLTEIDK